MRISSSSQGRLDCESIESISLNFDCRDEIIPVLHALQYVYQSAPLRDQILQLVGDDVNEVTSSKHGRQGFSYWEIVVLAAVRMGCNLDYDRLQDLAENHRKLRAIMGIGDWDERLFKWKRIRDNVCRLKPETLQEICDLVVTYGQSIVPDAAKLARADSFVIETNIHYPTESSLIYDGLAKVVTLASALAVQHEMAGWRQHGHFLRKAKNLHANIGRHSRSKSEDRQRSNEADYKELLRVATLVLDRAEELVESLQGKGCVVSVALKAEQTAEFIRRTRIVCDTAYRRVVLGETVPNADKIFSIFEPHTQLYRRGKAGQENQFGRMVLIFEDGAGFITHCHVPGRTQQDSELAIPHAKLVQEKLNGQVDRMSFDRGFYTELNVKELEEIVSCSCLPKRHPTAYSEQMETATVEFRKARKWHSGIESAIGALQSGNGLERCRDRTEVGLERYVHLAVLGRNLHVLGKVLIAARSPGSVAAKNYRKSE